MHITIRYGNKEGTPIHHLRESIKEGRCSPRGKSIQGTLKKEIQNFMIQYPNKNISIDLRANTNQIVAVGVLSGDHYYSYNEAFWSGDRDFKNTFSVKWKKVFQKPLSYEEFCFEYDIKENQLLEKPPFHAHHGWISNDLDLSNISQCHIPEDYATEGFFMITDQNEEIKKYFDQLLRTAMSPVDYENVKKHYDGINNIISNYTVKTEDFTNTHFNIQTKKKKKKKSISNSNKNFKLRFKKNYKNAIIHLGEGASTTEIAKFFKQKKYKTIRKSTNWNSKKIQKYSKKYFKNT
jgi:hypothetical protein